ncbi:ABC transporter substrate-binding protein [Salinispirillum sp. LH 10-3-1]|uniref:Probable sugar-binding periplasmic protein n=1 Tax=Salinispirillum sp. LH 10-3-1 TaxID=2952525 RepID=A0AB38YHH4_9GAMM
MLKRLMAIPLLLSATALAQPLEVLHWWTSAGEHAAADILRQQLTHAQVEWQDYAVPGGGGDSAMAVLKARVIAGQHPGAAQIIGPNIRLWARLGYLQPLDDWSTAWPGERYATLETLTHADGVRTAVPVSIHRINWMWLNPALFQQYNLPLPTSWSQVFQAAEVFQAAGIVPLAHGAQAWQTATLFETLLLSVGGPEFYRAYFVDLDPNALHDVRVAEALSLLRRLKGIMDPQNQNREWQEASQMVINGDAAMQIMGDWVKGEFTAQHKLPGKDYLCMPVPGTAQNHLYSADTFVFFRSNKADTQRAQAAFAHTVLDEETQRRFSLAKGTIPARADIKLEGFDDCSQTSAHVFREAEQAGLLAPSMAHSMATSPGVESAIFDTLHRFFRDDSIPIEITQLRLAQILSALSDHE